MRCRRSKVTEQIIVGTHGTLHTWISRRLLPLRGLRILVFDEADEMLKVHPPRLLLTACLPPGTHPSAPPGSPARTSAQGGGGGGGRGW